MASPQQIADLHQAIVRGDFDGHEAVISTWFKHRRQRKNAQQIAELEVGDTGRLYGFGPGAKFLNGAPVRVVKVALARITVALLVTVKGHKIRPVGSTFIIHPTNFKPEIIGTARTPNPSLASGVKNVTPDDEED